MGMALAVVAEKQIKALVVGIALAAGITQPPLPDTGCGLARSLQHFGNGKRIRRNRDLPLMGELFIVSDISMPLMHPGQERTTRWSTDSLPAVMLGEFDALPGHPVNMGGPDLFLPIAPKVAIPQIIRQNINNIGLPGLSGQTGKYRKCNNRTLHS